MRISEVVQVILDTHSHIDLGISSNITYYDACNIRRELGSPLRFEHIFTYDDFITTTKLFVIDLIILLYNRSDAFKPDDIPNIILPDISKYNKSNKIDLDRLKEDKSYRMDEFTRLRGIRDTFRKWTYGFLYHINCKKRGGTLPEWGGRRVL